MTSDLAKVITASRTPAGARLRTAQVTSTSPLQVDLDGGTVDANCLTSYSPTVDDVVTVLVDGNNLLVLGVST